MSIQRECSCKRRVVFCIKASAEVSKRPITECTEDAKEEKEMQEMTAEQAVFLLQNIYLGTVKIESRLTKKIIEAVPADKCEHRPDPASRSAIELARHIAGADNRFLETVINGVFETTA